MKGITLNVMLHPDKLEAQAVLFFMYPCVLAWMNLTCFIDDISCFSSVFILSFFVHVYVVTHAVNDLWWFCL